MANFRFVEALTKDGNETHSLNDEYLAKIGSLYGKNFTHENSVEDIERIIEAARFEMSRRQNEKANALAEAQVKAAEALGEMADAQNKTAKSLKTATWVLVVATGVLAVANIALVFATVWHH